MANNDDNNLLPTFVTSAPVVYNRGGAVHITGLSLLHDGGRTLFENADVTLNHGSIVGLVGTNGAGKTSLARIISSRQLNGFPSNLVVEYLAASDDEEYLASVAHNNNDASYTLSLNPTDYIEHRVQLRTEQLSNQIQELESKLDGDSDLQQEDLERISDQLATMYDLEEDLKERVQREVHHAFDQLGLRRYQDKTFEELSSGWRFKCRLVAAFLTHPDLFIIDEPSFLDEESTEWFVTRTKEAALTDSAMVLLISHKEALLETLCDTILYINSANKTLTTYHCGYEIFRSTHDDQVESAHKKIMGTEKKQQSADKSLQKIQKELRGKERNLKATTTDNADQRFIKAAKVKQLKKKAGELEEARIRARTERVKPLHLESVPVDGKVISLQDVAASYDASDGVVFEYVDVCMEATDKVLLKGKNGCGKSTLVKVILGELQPTHGNVSTVTGNIVYFPQVTLSDLLRTHGSERSVDFLEGDDNISITELDARHHLAKFGLDKDLATRPINTLSAGQRVRLWLAKEELRHPKPSLMIVDEISENVDRETRDSLVQLISTFEAAVLVISHDPDFCCRLNVTKQWELFPYGIRETYV